MNPPDDTPSEPGHLGDVLTIRGCKRRSAGSLAYEQRVRDMASRLSYAILADGRAWRLCKLDGSEEYGPFATLARVATRIRVLTGHEGALPLPEEIVAYGRDDKGASGLAGNQRRRARENRGWKAEHGQKSMDERRIAYIKRRHEVHKLRKAYPEIDFDGPRRAYSKRNRWHSNKQAGDAARDLRNKLG